MNIKSLLQKIFKKHFFNPEWQCSCCGEENFDGGYFCKKCESKLPYNDGYICAHCGRKVLAPEPYCSTCAEVMVSIDKARSVFSYQPPISDLILDFKYRDKRYLAQVFAEKLYLLYMKNYFNADYLTFVPMTNKAKRKRGYNQSELLAKGLSEKVGVPIFEGLIKNKETQRQAKLKRRERLKNLNDAFSVVDKKSIKDKVVVLIDDVTTTGSTAQVIASKLKKAGAKSVCLITVASTPPIDKY